MAFDFNNRNNEIVQNQQQDRTGGFTDLPWERQASDYPAELPGRYRPGDYRPRRRRRRRRRTVARTARPFPWRWLIGIILLLIIVGFVWMNKELITIYFVRVIVYVIALIIFLYLLKKLIFP